MLLFTLSTDGETEAQSNKVACSRSHGLEEAGPGFEPRSSVARVSLLSHCLPVNFSKRSSLIPCPGLDVFPLCHPTDLSSQDCCDTVLSQEDSNRVRFPSGAWHGAWTK